MMNKYFKIFKIFTVLYVLSSVNCFADYIMIQSYYSIKHDTIGVAHWNEYGNRFAIYQQCESSLMTLFKEKSVKIFS